MLSNFHSLYRPIFFLRYSRIGVDLLLYDSKMTDIREQYDWIAEKNWTGGSGRIAIVSSPPRGVTFAWESHFNDCLLTRVVQILSSPQVVLLSYISRFADARYQIDSYMTGSQKKYGWVKQTNKQVSLFSISMIFSPTFPITTYVESSLILWPL